MPGQGGRAERLRGTGQPADAMMPLVHALDGGEAFPGGTAHLAAADGVLGGVPLLHVIGRAASYRAVPHDNDAVVLPGPGVRAQLLADAPSSRGDAVHLPGDHPRLAAHHLPGVRDQLVLPLLRDLVRAEGPGRRVGADWRVQDQGPGADHGEPHPGHLDPHRPGAHLECPRLPDLRVRLEQVLGHPGPCLSAALHARAATDSQQRGGRKAEEGMKPTWHRIAVATVATAVSLMLAACAGGGGLGWPACRMNCSQAQRAAAPAPVSVPVAKVLQPGNGVPIGIYEAGFPQKTAAASSFSSATGVRPRMLVYYSGWGQDFVATFAKTAHAGGAVPVVK